MIPILDEDYIPDYEEIEIPSYTHKIDTNKDRINDYIDELEAVKQAIYKILNTERYDYPIYSWNYGVELSELIGQPVAYVYPEIERRVTEALMADDRIDNVSNFEFSNEGEKVFTTFEVETIFGNLMANLTVEI